MHKFIPPLLLAWLLVGPLPASLAATQQGSAEFVPSTIVGESSKSVTRLKLPTAGKTRRRAGQVITTRNHPSDAVSREYRRTPAAMNSARVVVYFDAALTQRHICTTAGQVFDAYIALENAGLAYAARFKVDKGPDTTLTFLGDIKPIFGSGAIGSSQSGIQIAWFGGYDASNQLHILTVRYRDEVGCGGCDLPARPIAIVSDPAEPSGEVLWANTPSLDPVIAEGLTSYSCSDGLFVDLVVTAMTSPTSAAPRDDISAGTSATVRNDGSEASGPFSVRMFHSADAAIDATDLELTNGTALVASIDAGDSAVVTFPGLAVPDIVPLGSGYLGVIADVDDVVLELSETNNRLVAPIEIDPYAPNVAISGMTTPATAEVWEDISGAVSVTVKNAGTGATDPFQVGMLHSTDATITVSDLQLFNGESAPLTLSSGDSAVVTFPGLRMPLGAPGGAGFLGAIADVNDDVVETSETDNMLAAPIDVDTSYVNLVISDFIAPPSAELGELIDSQVSVLVANVGTIGARGFSVKIAHKTLDSAFTGIFLADAPVASLAAGETTLVSFPGLSVDLLTPSGLGYLWTQADFGRNVGESDETDNEAYSLITIGGAGDTVCVYFEDFSAGDGGWAPVNLTGQFGSHWHVAMKAVEAGLSGSFAWFGSTVDSTYAGPGQYNLWEGYGSNWVQRVSKIYTLPAAPVSIEYDIVHRIETGFDFVYAQVRTASQDTFTVLDSYTGAGQEHVVLDLSPYAGQTVEFEFLFRSDGSDDDSDGYFSSLGFPVGIDNVEIPGLDFDDFESGGDEGWVASGGYPSTPGSYRRVISPECFPGFPGCDTTSTGGPFDACHVWVAYDSTTGAFPYRVPVENSIVDLQAIVIESPTIALPSDGNRYYLEGDIYWDHNVDNHIGLSVEWTFDGVKWFNGVWVYVGTQGWEHFSLDISPQVLNWFEYDTSPDFAVRWGSKEVPFFSEFTGPSPGPYIDNLSVKVAGTSSSAVACTPTCGPLANVPDRPPARFELLGNHPNPFHPVTTISFVLAESIPVRLAIYDVSGRRVRTLVDEHRPPGRHQVDWDGRDDRGFSVESGVYFYRIDAGPQHSIRRTVRLR